MKKQERVSSMNLQQPLLPLHHNNLPLSPNPTTTTIIAMLRLVEDEGRAEVAAEAEEDTNKCIASISAGVCYLLMLFVGRCLFIVSWSVHKDRCDKDYIS